MPAIFTLLETCQIVPFRFPRSVLLILENSQNSHGDRVVVVVVTHNSGFF